MLWCSQHGKSQMITSYMQYIIFLNKVITSVMHVMAIQPRPKQNMYPPLLAFTKWWLGVHKTYKCCPPVTSQNAILPSQLKKEMWLLYFLEYKLPWNRSCGGTTFEWNWSRGGTTFEWNRSCGGTMFEWNRSHPRIEAIVNLHAK